MVATHHLSYCTPTILLFFYISVAHTHTHMHVCPVFFPHTDHVHSPYIPTVYIIACHTSSRLRRNAVVTCTRLIVHVSHTLTAIPPTHPHIRSSCTVQYTIRPACRTPHDTAPFTTRYCTLAGSSHTENYTNSFNHAHPLHYESAPPVRCSTRSGSSHAVAYTTRLPPQHIQIHGPVPPAR